ncbi:ATP-binding cassette domain-containing protein [Aureimonas sp. ME7]|uniref:ATP-binding cassette domain-containing protein n=1 Tax=Aureimonas sp. ME7 TaxID=2744252 RepID=UPI0015F3814B|nr:ATP-binding cassette domain-containing protein [Aureimonas sp. ME7]
MSARLAIRDLRVRFPARIGGPAVTGLDGVSLEAEPGEVVALIGSSGAGKSLLAHAVLGLLPPDAAVTGTMLFEGEPLDPAAWKRLRGRHIALVPQSVTHLDPLLSVGRQLALAARRAGAATPGPEALRALGLGPDVAALRPHQISGGTARRILLLMGLVGDPRLILADEPTDHLDEATRALVFARLRAAADRGACVLLVTHDLPGVLPVADRVAILHEGRLMGIEPPAAFEGTGERLRSAFARRLWQALPQNGFGSAGNA